MASAQLTGEDFFVGLDRRRRDVPGQELEPVPTQPSTTAYGITKRFDPEHLAGIEAGVGTINTTRMDLLPLPRRSTLPKLYERTKEQAAHAYTGALTLRSHIGFWAEAGIPLAAELMGGPEEPRANAVHILDRSIAGPTEGLRKIRCRWEAGYFAGP